MSSESILSNIHDPSDLRTLSLHELKQLSAELREVIVATVSKNGGHLASNLGVVELTIALHRVFDSPRDKIVWDVGHQCYTHKLLTGRYSRFSTLRQAGGLAGFPKRSESPTMPLILVTPQPRFQRRWVCLQGIGYRLRIIVLLRLLGMGRFLGGLLTRRFLMLASLVCRSS